MKIKIIVGLMIVGLIGFVILIIVKSNQKWIKYFKLTKFNYSKIFS
jgi:hypothetical protein